VCEVSAEEPDIEDRPECQCTQYAATYIWGEGDSVCIPAGSAELHSNVAVYHNKAEPKDKYEDFVKSLGATFYEDCKFCYHYATAKEGASWLTPLF